MRTLGALLAAGVVVASVAGCSNAGATTTDRPTDSEMPQASPIQTELASPAPTAPLQTDPYPVSGVFVGTLRSEINCPAIEPDGRSPWPYGTTKLH
jgi:multidrug efflux pump subunit AcrA (membrane-fusion protein)